MADPGEQYEQFFDAIRAANLELTDAQRSFDWARYWNPNISSTLYTRLDRARINYSHAVDQLIAYILQ